MKNYARRKGLNFRRLPLDGDDLVRQHRLRDPGAPTELWVSGTLEEIVWFLDYFGAPEMDDA